jgi:hypothetical protein
MSGLLLFGDHIHTKNMFCLDKLDSSEVLLSECVPHFLGVGHLQKAFTFSSHRGMHAHMVLMWTTYGLLSHTTLNEGSDSVWHLATSAIHPTGQLVHDKGMPVVIQDQVEL